MLLTNPNRPNQPPLVIHLQWDLGKDPWGWGGRCLQGWQLRVMPGGVTGLQIQWDNQWQHWSSWKKWWDEGGVAPSISSYFKASLVLEK